MHFSPACRGWSPRTWLLGAAPGSLSLDGLGSFLLGAGVPVEGVGPGEPLEEVRTSVLWLGITHQPPAPQTEAQRGEASCPKSHSNSGSHILPFIPWVGMREKPETA